MEHNDFNIFREKLLKYASKNPDMLDKKFVTIVPSYMIYFINDEYDENKFREKLLEISDDNPIEIINNDKTMVDIWTYIIRAIIHNNMVDTLFFVIDHFKINVNDDNYSTIFLKNCSTCCNPEIIKILINYGLNINKHVEQMHNNLLCAHCQNGNIDIVKLLVENGADINMSNNIALRSTARAGHENIIQFLIEVGADVNIENGEVLRSAACCGSIGVIKLLITAGINIELYGETALVNAIYCHHEEVIMLLIKHGVDINANNCYALTMAIKCRNPDMIKLLLKNGADINTFNSGIKKIDDGGIVAILCENGVDPARIIDILWETDE